MKQHRICKRISDNFNVLFWGNEGVKGETFTEVIISYEHNTFYKASLIGFSLYMFSWHYCYQENNFQYFIVTIFQNCFQHLVFIYFSKKITVFLYFFVVKIPNDQKEKSILKEHHKNIYC